ALIAFPLTWSPLVFLNIGKVKETESLFFSDLGFIKEKLIPSLYFLVGPCPEDRQLGRSEETTTLQIHDFNFLSVLGKGSLGKPQKMLLAVKTMKKTEIGHPSSLETEKRVLESNTQAKHPFVVKLFGCFQTPTHIGMAVEYAPGGDLWSYHHRALFPEPWAMFCVGCVTLGLEYLHSNKIIYREEELPQLMMKNPEERLGSGEWDAEEVKAHIFFEEINWEDLLQRKMNSPLAFTVKRHPCSSQSIQDSFLLSPFEENATGEQHWEGFSCIVEGGLSISPNRVMSESWKRSEGICYEPSSSLHHLPPSSLGFPSSVSLPPPSLPSDFPDQLQHLAPSRITFPCFLFKASASQLQIHSASVVLAGGKKKRRRVELAPVQVPVCRNGTF
ncbi:hypothetical protein JD844_010273, partial [Phrynosoma platyrhinos]